MFKLQLHLSHYPQLSGCQALDFERLWGLDEKGWVSMVCEPFRFAAEYVVPEWFARAYFPPNAVRFTVEIPLEITLRPEVVRVVNGSDIALSHELTVDRAMQLAIAGLFHALKKDRDEWKAMCQAATTVALEDVEAVEEDDDDDSGTY